MARVVRNLSIAALSLLLTAAGARAQATAQISGIVKDSSGAVLPDPRIMQFAVKYQF